VPPRAATPADEHGRTRVPYGGGLENFRQKVRDRRQAAGHPADGRDVVYVYRTTPAGGASYVPLFDLSPDVVRGLLAGRYLPAESRLFIHRETASGRAQHEELDPAAAAVIDPATGTAPLDTPRLVRGRRPATEGHDGGSGGMTRTVGAYHDRLVQAVAGMMGREVTQAEVKAAYAAAHPDRPGDLKWVMAADHCVNHTNRGACACSMTDDAVFERVARNHYRVRAIDRE
jgi:hypothetical protein